MAAVVKPEEHAERMKMYRAGKNDMEIARQRLASQTAIRRWRAKHRLASNLGTGKYCRPAAAARLVLYSLGWSDRRIAREQGVRLSAVSKWRERKALPANFAHGQNERYDPAPGVDAVISRVRRAIGTRLSSDIIEDAVADMCEAIFSGRLPLIELETAARRYGNRVLDQFASRFGPRSLDEDMTNDDGLTLLDLLQDDSASSWLEEMGATVW